jgi:hypothetical protein
MSLVLRGQYANVAYGVPNLKQRKVGLALTKDFLAQRSQRGLLRRAPPAKAT